MHVDIHPAIMLLVYVDNDHVVVKSLKNNMNFSYLHDEYLQVLYTSTVKSLSLSRIATFVSGLTNALSDLVRMNTHLRTPRTINTTNSV